ncbi:hypothetical protein B0H12DRAFT_1109641 [Mycena haematopus]|nr:hypothetical protein B0H12DRAFT_1109641 [Mycena haematopus]
MDKDVNPNLLGHQAMLVDGKDKILEDLSNLEVLSQNRATRWVNCLTSVGIGLDGWQSSPSTQPLYI